MFGSDFIEKMQNRRASSNRPTCKGKKKLRVNNKKKDVDLMYKLTLKRENYEWN
jgi:hypothetical protein